MAPPLFKALKRSALGAGLPGIAAATATAACTVAGVTVVVLELEVVDE